MMNLSISSNKPEGQVNREIPQRKATSVLGRPKWLLGLILVVSFIGFFDAAYLTVQHYNQGILPCVIFEGCEQVLSSSYAVVGGIPISLVGAVYYLTIFISAIVFFDSKNPKTLLVLGYLPMVGLAVSLFLIFLQLFVIKAICAYCLVSAISSALLFMMGLFCLKLLKKDRLV